MQKQDHPQRLAIHHAESRHEIDLPALMIVDERNPLPARLTNLSRHGFRLAIQGRFPAGMTFTLKVDTWPRLHGRVVWSDGGRTGCLFADAPSEKIYLTMIRSAGEIDRDRV
jgi:hypothetical protein